MEIKQLQPLSARRPPRPKPISFPPPELPCPASISRQSLNPRQMLSAARYCPGASSACGIGAGGIAARPCNSWALAPQLRSRPALRRPHRATPGPICSLPLPLPHPWPSQTELQPSLTQSTHSLRKTETWACSPARPPACPPPRPGPPSPRQRRILVVRVGPHHRLLHHPRLEQLGLHLLRVDAGVSGSDPNYLVNKRTPCQGILQLLTLWLFNSSR